MNAATQEMNLATQNMAEYALWSTVAVSVGTTLLIGPLLSALQANKITRQVGQQQTRAYVYPSFVGFFVSEDMGMEGPPPDRATVLVKIRNYGQSPAKMARAAMSREVWAFPPPPNERRKPVPFIDFAEDRHDMPPGNESENRLDFTLTDLDRDGIEGGKAALYVFGRIEYVDTFGDHHHTNFMFYSTGEDFIAGKFRIHAFGNEAT